MNENEQKKQENAAFHANAPTEKKDAPRNSGRNRPHRGGKNRNNGKDRPAGNRPGAPGNKNTAGNGKNDRAPQPAPQNAPPRNPKGGNEAAQKNSGNKRRDFKDNREPQAQQPNVGPSQKKNDNGRPDPNRKKNQGGGRDRRKPPTEARRPESAPTPGGSILDIAPEEDALFGRLSGQGTPPPRRGLTKSTVIAPEPEPFELREFTDEEIFGTSHLLYTPMDENGEGVDVVGVRFKSGGKMYYFDPAGYTFKAGDFAILDTARGLEFGEVVYANRKVRAGEIVQPLRKVVRPASKADIEQNEENKEREKDAFKIALEKIRQHKLDMKLVDAQYAFDNSKLLFYFTSAGRVDFRELVRDLASVFKTRIELRQIGIRDEAKIIGGIGICGKPLCCSRFLSNFAQVSIKMAKDQGLSLNSNKISGNCGRLMCCLNFENQTYCEEIKKTPPVGSIVRVDNAVGTVTETHPLIGMLKIRLNDTQNTEYVVAHRDSVTLLSKKNSGNAAEASEPQAPSYNGKKKGEEPDPSLPDDSLQESPSAPAEEPETIR